MDLAPPPRPPECGPADRRIDLDTRHLRALVAVVDEGTFTDAAIALRTTQASVSRSVQRLEAVLGHRLLHRTTRQVSTTAAGERVLLHARRTLAALDRLTAAATGGGQLVLGYAWAALGQHTVTVQRAWRTERSPGEADEVVLLQTASPSAGLLEGRCEVAVVRRPVVAAGVADAVVGTEQRWVALPADDPLVAEGQVRLADLVGRTVAVDTLTGTTSEELWPPGARPAGFRAVRGVDDWLSAVASGTAVGISAAATAAQHPRPGVVHRPLADAPPIEVRLVWWADDPPPGLPRLVAAARAAYSGG